MARNGSGVYSKVNTFVAGNTITAAGHNQNWDDLVAEMTNSVAADGQTTITGALKGANGTAANPSYSFASDIDTGGYRHGANEYGFATGGVAAGYFDSAQKFFMLGAADIAGLLNVTGVATFASTSHMALPSGNTAARPGSPAAGMFRYNSQTGNPEFYNTAWIALLSSLSGSQMAYGSVVNGTIAESNASNQVTFALKTLAGADPSAGDPVLLAFRNSTIGTGNYVYRTVTAALSLTLTNNAGNGSTLGTSNAVPFKFWLVLFDDAGTIRMGAINCVSGSNIYPLGQLPRATTAAEGGAGGADTAQTFYTGTAIASASAYVILGYVTYESGLVTAGTYNVSPTRIQLYGVGVPLPGQIVQTQSGSTTSNTTNITNAAVSTGVTANISPSCAAHFVKADACGSLSSNGFSDSPGVAIYRGSTQVGSELRSNTSANAPYVTPASPIAVDAPGATSSTTYVVKLHNHGTTNTSGYPGTSGGNIVLSEIAT